MDEGCDGTILSATVALLEGSLQGGGFYGLAQVEVGTQPSQDRGSLDLLPRPQPMVL